uniref:N-acylethanolamine-hydrolyzing acid amidase n=1 Tax=Plectus sambesii TaxID=2011161 RepID=A0A914X2G8_9BILA
MLWQAVGLFALALLCVVDGDRKPPRYRIALETPPHERWNQVIDDHLDAIPGVIEETKLFVPTFLQPFVFWLTEKMIRFFPPDLAAEMKGISLRSGLKLGEIIGLNILYDITGFDRRHILGCTSIVAQDDKGVIWHGRNLDYAMGTLLRNITIIVDFTRNNSVVFTTTTFASYVGVLTGQRPGAFSLSLNARYSGAYIDNILMELFTLFRLPISFAVRKTLEGIESYDAAVAYLSSMHMIAPCYLAVGGVKPGEGAIITRNRWASADVWQIKSEKGRWFLLETNYDHWKPTSDKRRKVGKDAMRALGSSKLNAKTLFGVMSVWPVMNNETIFTTVMSAGHPEVLDANTVVRTISGSGEEM